MVYIKSIAIPVLIVVSLLTSCPSSNDDQISSGEETASMKIEVMSFNIRLDVDDGGNSWQYRKPIVADYLNEVSPDIIGFQEPLENQVSDLDAMLQTYSRVGDGRNEDRKGESCPVFFNREIFTLLDFDTFWLSETPDRPGSIADGAQLPRIVTWVKLEYKTNKEVLFLFNTHFSHVSEEARRFSIEVMSQKMLEIAGDDPVIAMGDFNFELKSQEYEYLVKKFEKNNQLVNTMKKANRVEMGETTFNGFQTDTKRIIDFIFADRRFDVQSFDVDEVIKDGIFISDHWPLRAEMTFTPIL